LFNNRWLLIVLSWATIGVGGGCQALHPFAQTTKAKLSSAREWANGGLEAFQSGHMQRAQGFFKRATEQSPTDFRSRANLARTLSQSGELNTAIAEMQQAVKHSANDPAMLVELGAMYLSAGQIANANAQAEIALAANHRFASAWKLKGQIARSQNELDQALAHLHKAASCSPDRLDIHLELVNTYRAKDEPLKALAAVDHLLAQHPIDSQPIQAIVAKSEILMQLNQQSTAIATLRRAQTGDSTSAEIAARLVQLQIRTGRLANAKATLNQARIQFPDSDQLLELAQILQSPASHGQQVASEDSLLR
jgi:tetratricopeptide (TPR) repeat protein